MASVVLWTVTSYLIKTGRNYWIALVPAVFMTNVVVSYILIAPEGLSLPTDISYTSGAAVSTTLLLYTFFYMHRRKKMIAVS